MSTSLSTVHHQDFESEIHRLTEDDIRLLCESKSEFVSINCPACGGSNHTLEYRIVDLDYARCNACQTIYLPSCPTEQLIVSYLQSSQALRLWRESMPEHVHASRKEYLYHDRRDFVLNKMREFNVTPGSLLDIGGGNGEFAECMAESGGWDDIVSLDPQGAASENSRVEIVQGTIESFDTSRRFDVITLFEVLEHIVDPSILLERVRQFLAPDGVFILSTPNYLGFETVTLRERSRAAWFDHVCLYNPRSLETLLSTHGFQSALIETPGRFDVEIVRNDYQRDATPYADNPALRFLMEVECDETRNRFQTFLSQSGMSSHMKCAARLV